MLTHLFSETAVIITNGVNEPGIMRPWTTSLSAVFKVWVVTMKLVPWIRTIDECTTWATEA